MIRMCPHELQDSTEPSLHWDFAWSSFTLLNHIESSNNYRPTYTILYLISTTKPPKMYTVTQPQQHSGGPQLHLTVCHTSHTCAIQQEQQKMEQSERAEVRRVEQKLEKTGRAQVRSVDSPLEMEAGSAELELMFHHHHHRHQISLPCPKIHHRYPAIMGSYNPKSSSSEIRASSTCSVLFKAFVIVDSRLGVISVVVSISQSFRQILVLFLNDSTENTVNYLYSYITLACFYKPIQV